jgi:hypothetical protein
MKTNADVEDLYSRFDKLKRVSGLLKAMPGLIRCEYGNALLADLTAFLNGNDLVCKDHDSLSQELHDAKAKIFQLELALERKSDLEAWYKRFTLAAESSRFKSFVLKRWGLL